MFYNFYFIFNGMSLDSELQQVFSKTILSILADLNNDLVWIVLVRLPISNSYYYYS